MKLFKPVWKRENEKKAGKASETVTQTYKFAPVPGVKKKPVDENVIAEIALDDPYVDFCVLMAGKLTNPNLLEKVAKEARYWQTRRAAADKLAALNINTDCKNIYDNLLQNCD